MQFIGHFALFLYSLEDSFLTFGEFLKFVEVVAYVSHLYLIECASDLFSVSADEGDGASFLQESNSVSHLSLAYACGFGDEFGKNLFH